MNILVACEESQIVTTELRLLGHTAFSCDLLPNSGNHPEWHIQSDVVPLLNGCCSFKTSDGCLHSIDSRWDMILAFPPCTYLTRTGNRWFNIERYGEQAIERYKLRDDASAFFMQFINADCEKICVENPVGYMSSIYRKPDQIIHPYMFGDPERKQTCLWLKGLPLLVPTNIVEPVLYTYANGKTDGMLHVKTMNLPAHERSIVRSKTFPGIAHAIATQFTEYCKLPTQNM